MENVFITARLRVCSSIDRVSLSGSDLLGVRGGAWRSKPRCGVVVAIFVSFCMRSSLSMEGRSLLCEKSLVVGRFEELGRTSRH